MVLYFITGNANKLLELKSILPNVEQLNIDLPEIQEIDAKEIIKEKILEAFKHKQGEFIVEDTSLYIDSLNGLPGPLIKWFMKTIGNQGIFDIVKNLNSSKSEAKTFIGYAKNPDEIYYFEGSIKGKIVSPVGEFGFGWDSIFQPEGFSKTFAQMTLEEKNKLSMRRLALNKLKKFLN